MTHSFPTRGFSGRLAEGLPCEVGRPPVRRPFMGAAWSSHTSKNRRLSVAAKPARLVPGLARLLLRGKGYPASSSCVPVPGGSRSEEHTSELQSLMRISYAVFCLKKQNNKQI